jgi:hypothetical protein
MMPSFRSEVILNLTLLPSAVDVKCFNRSAQICGSAEHTHCSTQPSAIGDVLKSWLYKQLERRLFEGCLLSPFLIFYTTLPALQVRLAATPD